MNVGLFGGTFDPIHRGHLAVARAAKERFRLQRILFVPAGLPPHKQVQKLTPYSHRYAMTVLATSGEKAFIPSDLESPEKLGDRPSYTIDTVARVKRQLKKSDRLFFLIGIDAFKDIAKWREPEALLRETEFVVMARPGFSLVDIGDSLPDSMRPDPRIIKVMKNQLATGEILISGATLHLLPHVHERISATQIRAAARTGRKLESLVGVAVAEYIHKTGLYKDQVRTSPRQTSQPNVAPRRRK